MATKVVTLARPDGRVVVEHCLIAARPLRRMRGLLGRRSLPGGEGILLQPAASIHTFFMRFPIDVVFLDRELVVEEIVAAGFVIEEETDVLGNPEDTRDWNIFSEGRRDQTDRFVLRFIKPAA